MRINCIIEGCTEGFDTTEAVATNASYICKNHPRAVQCRAVPGRKQYTPEKDEADQEIHFQDMQFDPFLSRGTNSLEDEDKRRVGGLTHEFGDEDANKKADHE